jgi:hypothetical protein
MILFVQKTWFAWWILASVFSLRWLYLFSHHTDESAIELPDDGTARFDEGEIPRHGLPLESQAL